MNPLGRRLMLISNSFCFGQGYLEHCLEAIRDFVGSGTSMVFLPYAQGPNADAACQRARETLATVGIEVSGPAPGTSVREQVARAGAVFVGGGNTFRLLKRIQEEGLLEVLRRRADAGMPYLGASAGSNLAGPTIRTTNDMPIVQPQGFEALDLVPFQINPHYLDPDPGSRHMGETREQRIAEFHEENAAMVIGIREGAWITVEDGIARLHGATGARIFRRGEAAREWTGERMELWPSSQARGNRQG
jgi:dipeptidase E